MTKTGEAFCMSCGATVDAGAERCESCYSQLDQDVRAFHCPRCEKVLEFGTPQCPECSMKFKVKTVKPSDEDEDDKMLARLIDWGKSGRAERPAPEPPGRGAAGALTSEEEQSVIALLGKMSELADMRAEVASSMGTGLSEARERISRLVEAGPSDLRLDDLEAELASVSKDMERIAEVAAKTREVSGDISRTFSMPGPGSLAQGREMSLRVPAATGVAGPEDIADREEQLRKREEMVDRKIKAYAQKKKELDAQEASLSAGQAGGRAPEGAGAARETDERKAAALAYKVRTLHELVSAEGACDDIEACLASLGEHLRELVVAKSGLEQRLAQLEEGETEFKALMKPLDGLLGQLPTDVVERFSKTEEFKLYERVLDRLNV